MARVFSKKKERQMKEAAAMRKQSKEAPEVRDGLTESAEMLEINLNLTPDQQEDLSTWISDRMQRGLTSSERLRAIERIHAARENYEDGVPRDDMPMSNAHDVRLRWGAGQCDTLAVRIAEGLFGQDPVCRVNPRNARSVEKAPRFEQYLDYWHDEVWHLGDRGPDIADNVCQEGHKILFNPWRLEIEHDVLQSIEKQKYVNRTTGQTRWVNVDSMQEMVSAIEDGYQSEETYKVEEEKMDKLVMNGPDLEVLDFEEYVTEPWALPKNENDLPWEAVMQWYDIDTLESLNRDGEFYSGVLEKITSDITTPAGRKGKIANQHQTKGPQPYKPMAPDTLVQHWLWVGKYRLPGEKRMSKIMVLYHLPTKTVCWARRFKNPDGESPFTQLRFLELNWRWEGVSVMEMFDSIEQAVQNLINYTLDETYMLASMPFKYRENRWDPEEHPMRPFHGLGVKSMNDVEFTPKQDRRGMDVNLMNLLVGFGQQRVQIGPYQQGQESPANKQATARGIFMLLEQASKLFNRAVRQQLKTWKTVFRKEAALWQMMMPEYLALDVVGSDGETLFPLGLGRRDIIGKFRFELSGNMENVLYELDQQVNMALYELLQNNPFIKSSISSLYGLTEDLINSFKKKRKLLPPLEEIQKKFGLLPTKSPLTPQKERQVIAELKAAGLQDEQISKILEQLQELPVDEPMATPAGGPGGLPPGQGPQVPGQPPVPEDPALTALTQAPGAPPPVEADIGAFL